MAGPSGNNIMGLKRWAGNAVLAMQTRAHRRLQWNDDIVDAPTTRTTIRTALCSRAPTKGAKFSATATLHSATWCPSREAAAAAEILWNIKAWHTRSSSRRYTYMGGLSDFWNIKARHTRSSELIIKAELIIQA